MKNLKITVNGVAYNVQVEETNAPAYVPAQAPAPAPVAPAPVAAAPAPAPAPAAAPEAAPAAKAAAPSAGANVLKAPMPGNIMSIAVSAGQSIQKGQVILILEAMKMENEIIAPADAVVAGVHVNKGDMVNPGDPLVSFQ